MTAKTIAWKPNGQPEKMAGWFSWRHKTREAHDDAVANYHSREDRRIEAKARNAVANATGRLCGHVHGDGVGCQGRTS